MVTIRDFNAVWTDKIRGVEVAFCEESSPGIHLEQHPPRQPTMGDLVLKARSHVSHPFRTRLTMKLFSSIKEVW